MVRSLSLAALVIFFSCAQTSAQDMHCGYDPLERGLVFIEGQAEITVPVNIFEVSLGFEVQKATFSEAREESERIIAAVDKEVKTLGLTNVEIIKGWDLVRQAKISIGQSGSKLSNSIIIKVRDFPVDRLHELIASIIDKSLYVNKDIYLEGVQVGLSEDVENAKKEEVLAAALVALKSNADKAAVSQGSKVVAAKRVFVTSNQETVNASKDSYDSDWSYKARSPSVSSIVSVQKGFNVRSQIVDHMDMTARVSGIYQIE